MISFLWYEFVEGCTYIRCEPAYMRNLEPYFIRKCFIIPMMGGQDAVDVFIQPSHYLIGFFSHASVKSCMLIRCEQHISPICLGACSKCKALYTFAVRRSDYRVPHKVHSN